MSLDLFRTPFGKKLVRIMILAFTLRLGMVALAADVPLTGRYPTDQGTYIQAADRLLQTGQFNDHIAGPLYPAFLAMIKGLTQWSGLAIPLRVAAGIVQASLGVLTVMLVGLLARKRLSSDKLGLRAALLLAIWPNAWLGTAALITERLSTPLFVVGVFCLLYHVRPPLWWLAVSGVSFGLAILTRPTFLPVLLIAGVVVGARHTRRVWQATLVVAASALIVVAPWVVHATTEAGGFIPVSSAGGLNLCLGNADGSTGSWSNTVERETCPWPRGGHYPADDAARREQALSWIVANPEEQPRLVLLRVWNTIQNDSDSLSWYPSYGEWELPVPKALLDVICSLWWFAMVASTVKGWRRLKLDHRYLRWQLTCVSVASVAVVFVTIGDMRFHDAVVPFMAIFAANAVYRRRQRSRIEAPQHEPELVGVA